MSNQRESQKLLPQTNQFMAEQIFALEVGLRELIIETLSDLDGAKWYTTRLPSDVTRKYLRGLQAERASTWTNHIEHHPLYYVDFSDLAKVLEKNWKPIFQRLFSDKAVFLGSLRSLEPLRNKLAHNRKVSDADCEIIGAVITKFECALGGDRFRSLVTRCSLAPAIPTVMKELIDEVNAASDSMASLAPAIPLNRWPNTKDAWWFDSTYLTATNHASKLEVAESRLSELKKAVVEAEKKVDNLRKFVDSREKEGTLDITAPVVRFFDLYDDFAGQPRTRGKGHKLELWRDQQDIQETARGALNVLESLMSGGSNE